MLLKIPALKDITQETGGKLVKPEIRVWCHPHFNNEKGEDYYIVFDTFDEALRFCEESKVAESVPLIAYGGYEINLFEADLDGRDKKRTKKSTKKISKSL